MNIFVLAKNPEQAARYHCDRHVVKMILESAQLLSTAHHLLSATDAGSKKFLKLLYKPTHAQHPCAVWVRQSSTNYLWLHSLMWHLLEEYRRRYGNKEHACEAMCWRHLQWVPQHMPRGPRTPFAQCMPAQYKSPSAVSAYRKYYRGEKRSFAKWSAPAKVPTWFKE